MRREEYNYRKKYSFNVKMDQLVLKKLLSGRYLDGLSSFALVNAGPLQETAKIIFLTFERSKLRDLRKS